MSTPTFEVSVITGSTPLEDRLTGASPGAGGIHPRLHLTAQRWHEYRRFVLTPRGKPLLARLLTAADASVANPPPATRKWSYNRDLGNALPPLAMAHRLTGEAKYLDAVRHRLELAAGYEPWDTSLGGGHMLYGTAIAYDWLHDVLGDAARAAALDALSRNGKVMFDGFRNYNAWATTAWTCNHYPVALAGLTAAGGAIYGDAPDIGPWLRLCMERAFVIASALPDDGTSQEGTTYGQYFLTYFLRIADLLRDLVGMDLFSFCPNLRNANLFHLYMTAPRRHWAQRDWLINLGDGYRYTWYGPSHMASKFALEYRDPQAQWFARQTIEAGVTAGDPHLDIVWLDPKLPEAPPDDPARGLPAFHHFTDKGLIVARSGWHGDENVLVVHAGPFAGWKALRQFPQDAGGGHMHPDAGNILFFANGQWLLVDDDYTKKITEFQNVAKVNGVGQEGDGVQWFEGIDLRREKRGPRVVYADTSPRVDEVLTDLAPAYRPEAGLTKYERRVWFLKPDVVVIVDHFETSGQSDFELYFHAELPWRQDTSGAWSILGERGGMRLTALSPTAPGGAEMIGSRAFTQTTVYVDNTPIGKREALVLSNKFKAGVMTFVTVLQSHPAGGDPGPRPTLERDERQWRVSIGSRHVRFEA